MAHRNHVTSTDVALLRSLARERSLVSASRRVGISRDSAVYRITRLREAFGGPVVQSVRGGADHGRTLLTPLGDRIARGGFDSLDLLEAGPATTPPRPNRLRGTYRRDPQPTVLLGRGVRLRVAFSADEGERVTVVLDPEAVLVARRRFPSSARNVLAGTVETVTAGTDPVGRTLHVRVGGARLRVAVTGETVRSLGLTPGARVVLYVKATSLRRVAPPDASS
ncbi:MAG: TOBE domain-containing protein [Thermoplasmata archaeon]|jgi:molybdopterin-binding protein/molybdate transport repressor ModE-like protein